jgi:phosphatidate cytidylyltransferase
VRDSASQPVSDPPAPAAPAMSNLALRAVSAMILAPIAVGAAWLGSWPFAVFWLIAALLVLWEWIHLVAGPGHKLMFSASGSALAVAALVEFRDRPIAAGLLIVLGGIAALIFAQRGRRVWIVAGIGYSGMMLLSPLLLRIDPDYGFLAIVLLFAVVWATDIVAYFVGRAIGGPLLCPSVSPKKTWSGAVGGAVGAMAAAVAIAHLFGANRQVFAVLGLLLSVVAQLGDLLESWIKRHFGAKDASHLIPGHGGVMDRLDGFWAAALVACLIGLARGGLHNAALGLLIW